MLRIDLNFLFVDSKLQDYSLTYDQGNGSKIMNKVVFSEEFTIS